MEATSASQVMDNLDIGYPGDGLLESPRGLVPRSILQEAMDRRESIDLLNLVKSPPHLLSRKDEGESEAEGFKASQNAFEKFMAIPRSASLGATSWTKIPSFGSIKRTRESPQTCLPPQEGDQQEPVQ